VTFISVAVSIAENRHNGGRGRRSCAGGSRTSAILAVVDSRHIQSMPIAVEDVLELSPPARWILADLEWQND